MWKKWVVTKIIIGLFLFCSVGTSFGFLEKRVYCIVDEDMIQVFLYKENAYKCVDYVAGLEQSVRKLYQDMINVQKFVMQKQDVEYWQWVLTQLQWQLDHINFVKQSVRDRVQEFETNLFDKIMDYMWIYLEPYQDKLQVELYDFGEWSVHNLSGALVNIAHDRVLFLQHELDVVWAVLHVESLEELIKHIPDYLYLKKNIWWK